ncbi:toll-like receptor 4 [Gigantopelta aegis]|uniref:toll-like receptor 4 n=1 Tax=Gigantopelta aegis TaxID=1735272 RepID=UPI001B8876CB|nr:toll-like receptor 4 [Gigantopelta aegis]
MGFNDNSKTGEYPDVIFQPLSRLQELTIDSFKEAKFSSGFGAMKSLTALNLSGTSAHCNIEILYNDSLSVFNSSSISTLDLSSCNIYKMHVDALAPLKHLKKFNLENSPIGLHKSLQVLHGLRGTNMSSLNFKKVDNEYFSIIDRIYDEQLLSEYLQYLETICVSELNLAENNILYIDLESLFNKIIKHKTQAIYFFKNLIRKCTMCPTRADFEFDICLCYADRDWREACLAVAEHLERRHNYKIYLHDRNSIPGEPLAESIMYGINNSWKTILLFTHNFIDDGWSWFTVQVAVSAVTWRTPYRLIVLRDPRRACELPDCILCVVDEDRIIPMPDQEVETSWDDLVRLI